MPRTVEHTGTALEHTPAKVMFQRAFSAMVAGQEGLPCACNRGTISEKWKTETHGSVERFSAVGKHGEME